LACERCDGTGFEIVDKDGREYARPCACRGGVAAGGDGPDAALNALKAARIPPRYRHCTFENFDPGQMPRLRAALQRAIAYHAGWPHQGDREGLGLLFTGSNGVGKTHLAVAVLIELMQSRGVRGQFWDFHELIREIRGSYDAETRTTELQVLEPVVDTPLLVLDDLGAWKMTDWMNDTLFYILNSRYLAQRATIITTNYPDVDREKALAADPLTRREYLVERIGQRLRSRLMEMCVVVEMDGTDHRRAKQDGNRFHLKV
jgi:DNA replication protein DnaC